MANNNDGQIVLGLDIPKTVSQINADIKKLQSQLDQVKATGTLDESSTVKQINAQIAALQGQLQKINIQANIDLNKTINSSTKQAQQAGQQIGQQFQQGFNSAIQKGQFQQEFFFSADKQNKVAKDAQKYFSSISNGIVSVKERMQEFEGNSTLSGFVVNIKNAKGEVESLRYSLRNIVDEATGTVTGQMFKYTGGSINDKEAIKQIQAIENAFADYTQKLAQFKSTNTNILSGLATPLQDFETKLAGLKNGTSTIDEVRISFKSLGTEASKITANFTGTLSKTDAAIRKLAQGDEIMDGLKASFKGLTNAPKDINTELNKVSKLLRDVRNIESQEGRTANWSAKYREWSDEVDKLKAKLSVLQKQQASMTTPQIFKTSDLRNADIPYMTKVSNTIEKQMAEIQRMANAKGWQNFEVKGVEEADGKIKALTLTVRDAEGALKQFTMQRAKLQGSGKAQTGLMQVGDVKVLETASQAQEKLANDIGKVREKSEQARQAEEKRQELAQNKAVNKALEAEYKERQKNIQAAEKQAELDRKNALAFTESASKKLSSAIAKYSYGDSSDATAMMQQMNRGLSNFGDLSNIEGNIKQLSSTVDKIIADLKLSHEQSLSALNQEINAEQTLQSQKDSFNQKNLNAIDFEIQKREQEAKAFSSMLQSQMQEEQKLADQANKIQLSFDDGTYTAKYDTLIAKTKQWVDANDVSVISTQKLTTAYEEFNQAASNYAKNGSVDNRDILIQKEEELARQIKTTTNEVRAQNAEYAKTSKIDSLHQRVQEFYDKNTAAHWRWGSQLKKILNDTSHGAKIATSDLNNIEQEFIGIINAARQAGKLGKSWFDTIKSNVKSYLPWVSMAGVVGKTTQQIRKMYSAVYDIDTAMTNLYKVTDETDKKYAEFLDGSSVRAKNLGSSMSDLITQTSEWAKLGFSLDDSAKLAETSMIYSNVGEVDNATAVKDIVTSIKAFNIEASNSIDVVDKLNKLGKKYCPCLQ